MVVKFTYFASFGIASTLIILFLIVNRDTIDDRAKWHLYSSPTWLDSYNATTIPAGVPPPPEVFVDADHWGELPKVHLFVPVDKKAAYKSDRFCKVMQGAVVNGWCPIIYNWAILPDGREEALMAKSVELVRILSNKVYTSYFAEDDLIFQMDALDVWLQLSPRVMARRFINSGKEVLVSAEKNCSPQSPSSHACIDAPPSPIDPEIYAYDQMTRNPDGTRVVSTAFQDYVPRHANSGNIIGRLYAVLNRTRELVDQMQRSDYYGVDDQAAFNDLLVEGKIHLDYSSQLFWTAHDDADNIDFLNTRHPPDPSFYPGRDIMPGDHQASLGQWQEIDGSQSGAYHQGGNDDHGEGSQPEGETGDGRHDEEDEAPIPWPLRPSLGHHRLLGHVPAVLHLNGGSKPLLERWWGKLWWQSDRPRFRRVIRERMERGNVKFVVEDGYRNETLRELCPDLEPWSWDVSSDA